MIFFKITNFVSVKKQMILGQGGNAVVVGPVAFRRVRALFSGVVVPDDNAAYVVKAAKASDDDATAQKKQFYDRIREQSRHHTLILPLAARVIDGGDIVRVLPALAGRFRSGREYQVELQHYGGVSMEKVVYGDKTMSVRRFILLWRSIPDILEDCFHVITNLNLVLTDVKMENSVLSPDDGRLRLIDVDFSPNTKGVRRVLTPLPTNMPPQHFSDQWWADTARRDEIIANYEKGYANILTREDQEKLSAVMRFIHHRRHPLAFARRGRLSPEENNFQRVFFVAYPLLLMVVLLIANGRVRARSRAGKSYLKRVFAFCLGALRDRGQFAETFSYKGFQRFLWQMRSL